MTSLRTFGALLAAFATIAMLAGCNDSTSPTALGSNLDSTAPPAPSGLTLNHDALGRRTFTWDASTAPDVAGYQVYLYSPSPERDNAYLIVNDENSSDTSFLLPTWDDLLTPIYRVRAVDLAGNKSSLSAAVKVGMDAGGGSGRDPVVTQ